MKKNQKFKKPIILSTGMNDIKSIKESVNILKKSKVQFALLHCISEYPADTKRLNLDFINVLKKTFPNVVIGYSDHTLGLEASISAVALGARIIEKHFTIDRNLMGKDNQFSITGKEMKEIVKWRNLITQMNINKGLEIQNSEKASLSFKDRWNKDN